MKRLYRLLIASFLLTGTVSLSGCVKDDISNINDRLSSIEEDIRDLQSQIDELKNEIKDLETKESSDIQAVRNDYESKINALQEQMLTIKQDLLDLKSKYESDKKALEDDYEAKIAELDSKYAAEINELQEADGDNSDAIAALTAKHDEDKASIEADYNTKFNDVTVAYTTKDAELESSIATLNANVSSLTSEMNDRIQEIKDKYDSEIAGLASRLSSLENVTYHTVTFDGNGGSETVSQIIAHGEKITKPDDPTRTGYVFLGWLNEYGEQWMFGGFDVTSDITLTASWKIETHTLSVSSDDESQGSVNGEGSYSYNESVTVSASPKSGYAFKGWYNDGYLVSLSEDYVLEMPACDYSLTAKFIEESSKNDYLISIGAVPSLSSDGTSVTYGLYPNSHVSDSDTVSALNALYTGKDGYLEYNGKLYCQEASRQLRSDYYSFLDGTSITSGEYYWFEAEPIEWRVLKAEGSDYFIVSEYLLDAQEYSESYSGKKEKRDYEGNSDTVYSNNYKYSQLRTWLNTDFYKKSFGFGSNNISVTEVDNSGLSMDYSHTYACENTSDRIFTLSVDELRDSDYGFQTDFYLASTESRQCLTTEYSVAAGAWPYQEEGSASHPIDTAIYWTRTPDSYSDSYNKIYTVGCGGEFSEVSFEGTPYGVRPAMHITID